MVNTIPFIDMRRSPEDSINCWIVYLLPFNKQTHIDDDTIYALQQACIDNNIFGMGWNLGDKMLTFGTTIQDGIEEYKSLHSYDSKMEKALSNYAKIQKGDYILMRLKNGHYYIGRASESPIYIQQKEFPFSYFSWGCHVDRWEEFISDVDVPSGIKGRLSQRRHPTIQRIAYYILRLLVMKLYEDRAKERATVPQFSIPKIRITQNNFVRCLDYRQLEDMVALYIWERHGDRGYMLLPSSGKINQMKYEFLFINVNDPKQKPITCQVKNQENINIEKYRQESGYECIYLFSGRWDDEEAANKQKQCDSNVKIITHSGLFESLCHHPIFNDQFYRIDRGSEISIEDLASELRKKGYECIGDKLGSKRRRQKAYAYDGADSLYFVASNGLFYSEEVGALVCTGGDYTPEEIDTLQNDLASCLLSYDKLNKSYP